jgi:hypothetical protein
MPTLTSFGVPGAATGYLQPKLKNRWSVQFVGIATGTGGAATNLAVQTVTCSRPSLTFDEIQLDRYTTRAYIAGKYTWEDFTMSFEDDIGSLASTVVRAQIDKQQNLLGGSASPLGAAPSASGYKFAIVLSMLDGSSVGSDNPATGVLETWTLEGCWIKSANFSELDYASSEAVKVDLTIRFDNATYGSGSTRAGTALGGQAA